MPTIRLAYLLTSSLAAATGLMAQPSSPVRTKWVSGTAAAPMVARVGTPVLGHFVDRNTGQLQPLIGIPASGFAGDRLLVTGGGSVIEVAPSQNFALAARLDSQQLTIIGLSDGVAPAGTSVTAIEGIDRIALSPGSGGALIYASATRRAQLWHGLPDAPTLVREYDWTTLPDIVTAMALSDDGSVALITAEAKTASLYLVAGDAAPAFAFRAQSISSVNYLRNSQDLLLAAPADDQVIWIRSSAGGANPVVLADTRVGVSAPFAVMPSEDGSRAFAANRAGQIFSIPMSGGEPTSIRCGCEPTRLQRMHGRDVFLLTTSLESPLALVDGSGERIETLFVANQKPQAAASTVEAKQ